MLSALHPSRHFVVGLVLVVAIFPLQADARAPGQFPSVAFRYADAWTGWPVAPTQSQHPIRGSFLDPRFPSGHLHWGLDINVNDRAPVSDAPPARSHRV
jgi:hypothetical protein